MATRKTAPAKKTPSKTKATANKWANVQLPEGYTPISAGEYGDPWDFEAKPVLIGTIDGDIREVVVNEGKRTEYTTRAVTIAEEDGARTDVWESAALKGWFDRIEDGSSVSVVFQGYRDVGKPSPMKVFVGAIAQDEEAAPARKSARKTAKSRR